MNSNPTPASSRTQHRFNYLIFVFALVGLSLVQVLVWNLILFPQWTAKDHLNGALRQNFLLSVASNTTGVSGSSISQSPLRNGANSIYRGTSQGGTTTIAYAISFTSCNDVSSGLLIDAAAVLKHSIHSNSIKSSTKSSKYDYQMFAFVHPDAKPCFFSEGNNESILETRLGYRVLIRDTPIDVTKISSEFLKTTVVKRGCCGEKEFIKLYAYELVSYEIVVHLDLDTLILHPLDDLFDAMLEPQNDLVRNRLQIMYPGTQQIPKHIKAFFTRDYGMISPGKKQVPVQGGFLIVRPNITVLEEFKSIILTHEHRRGSGWGGSGYGGFYGAQQIQGLVPYYYDVLHPGNAVELNPCQYNNMAQSLHGSPNNPDHRGKCRTLESPCEDCFAVDPKIVKTFHFTNCPKPWLCHVPPQGTHIHSMCRFMIHEWYRMKKELDKVLNSNVCTSSDNQDINDVFCHCCRHSGQQGLKLFNFDTS